MLGTGTNSYWLRFGTSTCEASTFCLGVEGRFFCCSPSWNLKVLCFGNWGTCVACTPYPGSYSTGFGYDRFPQPDFDCFWLHLYFGYHLVFGALGHCYWCFDCYLLTPVGSLPLGFFSAF